MLTVITRHSSNVKRANVEFSSKRQLLKSFYKLEMLKPFINNPGKKIIEVIPERI